MKRFILNTAFSIFLLLFTIPGIRADNAPITTAGNASACTVEGSVTVPITVTAFNGITALQLRLDYDPTLMTYSSYTNANALLPGLMLNDVTISGTQHKLMIIWVDVTPVSLTNGSTLLELNFTYLAGSPTLSFNNSSNSGSDCEYSGINAVAMNDVPPATYYHDATITLGGVGAAGTITGTASVCKGATGVVYSVPAVSGATSYTWSYSGTGATIIGTTNSVTVNFAANATSGNLSVAGTNPACGAGVVSPNFPVTINSLPVPTITGSTSACNGSCKVYTTEPGMTAYLWVVSAGGTITAGAGTNAITVCWNMPGTMTVSVTYTNSGGCTNTTASSVNVTVNALPIPSITGPNSTPVGSIGNVYTTQAGKNNYQWTVSSGGTITTGGGPTDNTITVNWNTAGGQTVCVNYTEPTTGCSAAAPFCFIVTVGNVPTPPGPISGPASTCASIPGLVYSISPIANATGYVWTVPSGFNIQSGSNTTSISVDAGPLAVSGNVSVYGTNSYGNGAPSTLPVTVNTAPGSAVSVNGPENVCAGAIGVGYSVSIIPGATNYIWTVPAGVSIVSGGNTNMITVNFGSGATSGGFSVVGSNPCGNGPASSILFVTVNPIPGAPIATSPDFWIAQSSAPLGNQWFEAGAGIIPGATGQTYMVNHNGFYYAQVTLNGCISDTSNHVYVLTEGIHDLGRTGFRLFPVPNQGSFTLRMDHSSNNRYQVIIVNTLGSVISERTNVTFSGNGEKTFDIRPVSDGLYTVIVQGDDGVWTEKVMVIR